MEQRLLNYHNNEVPVLGPESIGIVPINACNLNCISCWTYSALNPKKPDLSWQRQILPFDIMSRTLKELHELGTKRIILTGGGDPLVYPHFKESIELIASLKLKSTLISNLTLVKHKQHFLEHLPDTILANFSAADAESYVAFHPNRNNSDFDKLLSLLESISARKCNLKLVFVVCSLNYHLIDKVVHIAAALKAAIQFKLMSPSEFNTELILSPQQKLYLYSQCDSLLLLAQQLEVSVNITTLKHQLSGERLHDFPIDKTGCFAGYYYSRIKADGSVWFCCNPYSELKRGSLHQQTFSEIWNSKHYQNIRTQMYNRQFVQGCNTCGKFQLNVSKSELYKNQI